MINNICTLNYLKFTITVDFLKTEMKNIKAFLTLVEKNGFIVEELEIFCKM